jgi:hypothetical protein
MSQLAQAEPAARHKSRIALTALTAPQAALRNSADISKPKAAHKVWAAVPARRKSAALAAMGIIHLAELAGIRHCKAQMPLHRQHLFMLVAAAAGAVRQA